MKCKNVECNNKVVGKKVYCSLSCRNIYVNKYMRDYDNISRAFTNKRNQKKESYYENPKKCKRCEKVIEFESRTNVFCSSSCSASFNNPMKNFTWGDKIRKGMLEYCKSIGKLSVKYCKECEKEILGRKKRVYCSKDCLRKSKRKNMTEYQKYKNDCIFKFNLSEYPDHFDFSLIEKFGWYSPTNKKNNLNGVSRDHMLSVREGFDLGIEADIIAHPANCRLMIHNENISKNKKSVLTKDELLERIEKFENKYGFNPPNSPLA